MDEVAVAERVAMMDHLTEGRFEFGIGRGSSSTEYRGFGIPDGDTTREMHDEVLPEILRMLRPERYSYEGRFFSMPERVVLPKPYTDPHPGRDRPSDPVRRREDPLSEFS
jgi:alkanesulfonate monooxygenase SsuD/methylene tetrahydromethanopterin reductase-like flavin-dependent oxidoreductase (luciferase family)